MSDSTMLLAVFEDIEPAANGIEKLHEFGIEDDQMNVISGIPIRASILERPSALTNVSRIALTGAILGFLLGVFFVWGTPFLFPLHVGGQPVYPVPQLLIIVFEMTMLGLMGFAFLGMFVDSGFPTYSPKEYIPEISDGRIAVFFSCPRDEQKKFIDALTKLGAESVSPAEGAPIMSTSLSVIIKRLAIIFIVVGILLGITLVFTYDVIKIQWVGFMAISPAMQPMYDPLPVPAQSIPIEGPAYIPNMGAPKNPVPADDASLGRGAELFHINCTACHGADGKGDGPVAPFLKNKKPADLTSPAVQFLSDGAIFMIITDGRPGAMPALNENLTVRERWDVVNFIRTLK